MAKNKAVSKIIENNTMEIVTKKSLAAKESLESIFAEFLRLEVADGKASSKTIRNYMAGVKTFLLWCKINFVTNPNMATVDTIKLYREDLVKKGYKESTIALKLVAVRRLFDALVEKKAIAMNPASKVKAPRDKTAREEKIKYLPSVSITAIIESINSKTDKGKRDKAIFVLFAIHGLRACEVASMKLVDIDLTGNKITVLGKGNKVRTVYLTEKSKAVLVEWLNVRSSESPFVFVNLHHNKKLGGTVSTRGLEKIIDGYLETCGLKKAGISCHALRHSAATLSLANGATLEAIRDMLGHSSKTTTEIYAKVLDRERSNPAKFLDCLF